MPNADAINSKSNEVNNAFNTTLLSQ
jgi:hypothetical protein